MPIYSENEAEHEDRLASLLAGAAATASLAASAAAALGADPDGPLAPRLGAALAAVTREVESVASLDLTALLREGTRGKPFPEELVARLAQSPIDREDAPSSPSDGLKMILADLHRLRESPSAEVAIRVEKFLAALSAAENAQAQALARGSLELELAVSSSLRH